MIEVLHTSQAAINGTGSATFRRGENQRMKDYDLNSRKDAESTKRVPQRSQTVYDYILPQAPTFFPKYTLPTRPRIFCDSIPSSSSSSSSSSSIARSQTAHDDQLVDRPSRKPPLGPPRRSYSVTDEEPILSPPIGRISITDLPSEVHYLIFGFLDAIDSTCLGLTNRHFYAIHRKLHGTVPLTARRKGPNELEWAWHLSGRVIKREGPWDQVENGDGDGGGSGPPKDGGGGGASPKKLSELRVRGQAYCRMCRTSRCELYRHIQSWMGEELEYCSVRRKFGSVAPEGATSYCYMSRPGDMSRCGRHWARSVRDREREGKESNEGTAGK